MPTLREELHIPTDWRDLPETTTPVDRATIRLLEERLAEFTERYEKNWKASVTNHAALIAIAEPTAGDVRLQRDTGQTWYYDGDAKAWKLVAAAHWLAPVTKKSELPAEGETGDMRFVIEDKVSYYWDNGAKEWKKPSFGVVHTIESPTWAVADKVTEGTIPGPFKRLAAASEETQTLTEIEFEILAGTEAEFELKLNGVAIKFEGGVTKIKVKKAAEALKLEAAKELKAKDKLTLVCTNVVAEPKGLALTAFIEHVAKVV